MKVRWDSVANAIQACYAAIDEIGQKRRRKRKRKIRRYVSSTIKVASALSAAASVALPQVRPAAIVLGAVQQGTSKLLSDGQDADDKLHDIKQAYLIRLKTIESLLPDAEGKLKGSFEAQRDLILKLLEDYERSA